MWEFIHHLVDSHWGIVASLVASIFGFLVGFLVITKVKVPMIEARLAEGEKKFTELMRGLEINGSKFVDEDGVPRYILRKECHDMRNSCQLSIDNGMGGACDRIDELKMLVERLVRLQTSSRTLQMSFISAVKEKLDLKFTIPQHKE